jgi:hypothetical protein
MNSGYIGIFSYFVAFESFCLRSFALYVYDLSEIWMKLVMQLSLSCVAPA